MRNVFRASAVLILGLAIIASSPAAAGDAKECVRVGAGKKGQMLTNTCNRKIEVIWCHDVEGKPFRRGVCGRKGKYFQKHHVLKPGGSYQNQYSLPSGGTIHFGACTGGYYATKQDGNTGNYGCKERSG